MDTKAAGKAGGREGTGEGSAAPGRGTTSKAFVNSASERERGRKGRDEGSAEDGEFQSGDGSGRRVEWSGEKRERQGERACVRESGRIELREKEGWMDGWMVGEESGLLG